MRNFARMFLYVNLILAPAIAYASPEVGGIGSGRLLPSVAAVIGIIGIILGKRSLNQARRHANGTSGAIVAGALGLISTFIGGLHVANSAGGFGTGNGLAGAIVAIALGLASMVLAAFSFVIPGDRNKSKL